MFSQKLKELMNTKNISATELSDKTGISKSAISQYLSGKNIPRSGKLQKIADVFGVPCEYLKDDVSHSNIVNRCEANNLPVAIAAKLMGKSPQFIRIGLQRGILPFGYAIKMDDENKSFSYYISPKKFTECTGIEIPKGG